MNVNSVSNNFNNYNSNSLNKVNNGPSFGALRADAANMFIKTAAAQLDQKSQNVVLQEVIRLAERAKQSKVLDIGATKGSKMTFIDTVYKKASGTVLDYLIGFYKDDAGKINAMVSGYSHQIPKEYGFTEASSKLIKGPSSLSGGVFDEPAAPLEKFIDAVIDLFNKKEAEIVDQIETDKVTQALTEKLNGLTVMTEDEKAKQIVDKALSDMKM